MFKAHKKQPGGMRYTPYRDQPPGTIFTDNMVILHAQSLVRVAKKTVRVIGKNEMACAYSNYHTVSSSVH